MITLLSLLIACSETKTQETAPAATFDRTKLAAFQPLPADFCGGLDAPRTELLSLGERLFRDPTKLSVCLRSANNSVE